MANFINPGTRVFIPSTVHGAVFGTLVKYSSNASLVGTYGGYFGGRRAFVLVDGDQLSSDFRPSSVMKDTPTNRIKHGVRTDVL